jgi:hypothetical protein
MPTLGKTAKLNLTYGFLGIIQVDGYADASSELAGKL